MEKVLIIASFAMSMVSGQGTPFTLTTDQWSTILMMHNDARNTVAAGTQQGQNGLLPAASDMNSLVWDAGLAELSQTTANLCDAGHSAVTTADLVGTSVRFELPSTTLPLGENLAFASVTPSFDIAVLLTNAWLEEVELYDYTTIPSPAGDAATGHYTAIIWADTRYVGCAMSDCTGSLDLPAILVCQFYRPGNFIGNFPYSSGTACSNCDGDRTMNCVATSTGFENLCAGGLDSTFDTSADGVVDICDDGLGTELCDTSSPSTSPSASPSSSPSTTPSTSPTGSPTVPTTAMPTTEMPSSSPTMPTAIPSASPSGSPSSTPSASPSTPPTSSPSAAPTMPTAVPSASPSGRPSATPTAAPSSTPSASPSGAPSSTPSAGPSSTPSSSPTDGPAQQLIQPSSSPSSAPTPLTSNPLYIVLDGLVGDTAARVILASDLTDAQVVALAALIASGASDEEILTFLRSTGISDAQVIAIAVALDLDVDGGGDDDDDDSSVSGDSDDSSDDSS